MDDHRISSMSAESVSASSMAKAERTGRTTDEVDQIRCWLTCLEQAALDHHPANGTDSRTLTEGEAMGTILRSAS